MTGPKQAMRAAGYTRVSTRGQADDGLSLADQAQAIRDLADVQGWTVTAIYEERGRSGEKDFRTRPEFCRMIDAAAGGRFDVLVVFDVTRFSRQPRDYFAVESELERCGVSLVTVDNPGFDRTDDGQVLGRDVQVVIGRFVARQSRAKSIRARQGKVERGEFNIGQRIPYGLRWADAAGTRLEHDPDRIRVWEFIKALRTKGYGCGRIAAILNGKEAVDDELVKPYGPIRFPVRKAYGRGGWTEGAIAGMMRDKDNIRVKGELTLDFRDVRGGLRQFTIPFPPLLTAREHKTFVALAKKNCTWIPRNVGKGSLLSGMCRCGVCGQALNVTGSRKSQYYGCAGRLRPRRGEHRCSLPLIRKADLELIVLYRVGRMLTDDKVFAKALAAANIAGRDATAELADISTRLARLDASKADRERQLARLVDAIADGALTTDDARAKRESLAAAEAEDAAQRIDLDDRRERLARTAENAAAVDAAKDRLKHRLGRAGDVLRMKPQEKADLLRTLLPPDGEARILVTPATAGAKQPWEIEITGLLEVERAELKFAVLGGAVAVP